jgi:L-threonylcarbamoyladenylate synthase
VIIHTQYFDEAVVAILKKGGIGILRTDTLYGVVARADDQTAVERVYALKQRTPNKPPISLINSFDQLFDRPDEVTLEMLGRLWPGKNTVILSSVHGPEWLTRGTSSVSYRLPDDAPLLELIAKTGPLIAPSANPEGKPPAMTIEAAEAYFGDAVDFYVDGGEVADASPSKLYRFQGSALERLR